MMVVCDEGAEEILSLLCVSIEKGESTQEEGIRVLVD